MALMTVRLVLARSKDKPEGDEGHGYEFRAPLDSAGRLIRSAWPLQRDLCTVKRITDGIETESGLLQSTSSGGWVFSYARGTDDDEAIFRLSEHTFVPGAYVSVTEHDGVQRTFRVASVVPWHAVPPASAFPARWPSRKN